MIWSHIQYPTAIKMGNFNNITGDKITLLIESLKRIMHNLNLGTCIKCAWLFTTSLICFLSALWPFPAFFASVSS